MIRDDELRKIQLIIASMTIEQQVVQKLRELSPEQKQQVLQFVDSLKENAVATTSKRSLLGLWQDLNCHISEEDIAEARREMWSDFPREIEP
jgi:hypothetical protein